MARVSDAHLEARKQSILLAACDVFSRRGVESATMAEIAAAAGISPGAIYRYFSSKDELAEACMTEGGEAVRSQWMDPSAAAPAFADLARATIAQLEEPGERTSTALYLQRVLQAVFAEDSAGMEEFYAEKQAIGQGIAARLIHEVEAGRVPTGLDLSALANMLYTFYLGARLVKLVAPSADVGSQVEQIISLFRISAAGQAR